MSTIHVHHSDLLRMHRLRAGLIFITIASMFCPLLLLVSASSQEPSLVRAEFRTKTPSQREGDNKDKDTGVFVVVTTQDKNTIIAQAANKDDNLEYPDNGFEHSFDLDLVAPGLPKSACVNFAFKVGILARGSDFKGVTLTIGGNKDFAIPLISGSPGGNDHWFFHAWVILHFSDGSTLEANKFDQGLNSTGHQLAWNNLQ